MNGLVAVKLKKAATILQPTQKKTLPTEALHWETKQSPTQKSMKNPLHSYEF
jgi:hypothetical protein